MSHIDSQKNKIPLLKYPERWISFALCPSKIGETRFQPREPASSLAKSSSRSSVRSSSSSSFGIRRRFGRAGSPFVDPAGDSAWTRGEQAPTIHHATTTNPIRPTKRTEREAAGQRSTWPNSLWNERRVKEREREREERGDYSLVCSNTQRGREPLYQKDRENVAAGLTDIYESFTRQDLLLSLSHWRSNFVPRGFAIFDGFGRFEFHGQSSWPSWI